MDFMTVIALMLAAVGATLIAWGMSLVTNPVTLAAGMLKIKIGGVALVIALVLTALQAGMNTRKNDKTVQTPPTSQQPTSYGNPNPGPIGYDPRAGCRPEPGFQPGFPPSGYPGLDQGGYSTAGRQFTFNGTLTASSSPAGTAYAGGANLALESGASTYKVQK